MKNNLIFFDVEFNAYNKTYLKVDCNLRCANLKKMRMKNKSKKFKLSFKAKSRDIAVWAEGFHKNKNNCKILLIK